MTTRESSTASGWHDVIEGRLAAAFPHGEQGRDLQAAPSAEIETAEERRSETETVSVSVSVSVPVPVSARYRRDGPFAFALFLALSERHCR